jgi:hypothetical protein
LLRSQFEATLRLYVTRAIYVIRACQAGVCEEKILRSRSAAQRVTAFTTQSNAGDAAKRMAQGCSVLSEKNWLT